MPISRHIIVVIVLCIAGASRLSLAQALEPTSRPTDKAVDPSFVDVPDDPNLPRVLLIGDSISMGYTIPVREMLKGKANVHRPPANCGQTQRGLDQLDKWLGNGKWDVIHFNFGLHDLKYLDASGKYVDPSKGKQVAPPEVYEKNLRELVARLKKTGAKLIFATTTPVPAGTLGRVEGDEVRYNKVAARVMADTGVAIDDLHAVAMKDQQTIQRPRNVHFTPEGYKMLAASAAASIERALQGP
ncbi:MAG TPA: SGNH/GDSL hydrolase family protein [Tepidisphaeraceae bacterium]|nr:SGNH/GDSL hydrolase family protein [Tepidisphaeraceae bacterium]